MVGIEVASEEEAYLIFETLNDRGLRLSVHDLLLNYLMRRAANAAQRRAVRTSWDSVKEAASYVVKKLTELMQSQYGDIDLSGYTIEHIFPINSQDGEWVEFDNSNLDVWHIGNLIPLEETLNRRVSRDAFPAKRDAYLESDCRMAKSVAENFDTWTPDTVEERARSLGVFVRRVWPRLQQSS